MLISSVSYSQVVTIRSITNNNSNGVPLDTGQFKTVAGVVTVANQFGGPSYIQDHEAGIAVFYNDFSSAVQIGDSVIVTAKLSHFNGLTELVYSTVGGTPSFTIVDSNKTFDAIVITLQQFNSQAWNAHEEFEEGLFDSTD